MCIYTENHTKSDTRIQNNNLEYKIHQKHKNTFREINTFPKIEISYLSKK